MTTTAEKINELFQDLTILSDDLARVRKELDALRRQDLSLIKPEPLECWVCLSEGDKISHAQFAKPDNRCWRKVQVREVTPQDEQDRKDAARYRWLIENGYNNFQVLWNNIPEWSAIIDKAME